MLRLIFTYALLLLSSLPGNGLVAQYHFSGELGETYAQSPIYLSLVEDYRRMERGSFEQILQRTVADSLGNFTFSGALLSPGNRIYRIHAEPCASGPTTDSHFPGLCQDGQYVLFLARNTDTVHFPVQPDRGVLCGLESTNPLSEKLLEAELLREAMEWELSEWPSRAHTQQAMQAWFDRLQAYGSGLNEPLLDLYAYQFLSDRSSPAYSYYLEDLKANPYYETLGNRLQEAYPGTAFTEQYARELAADLHLASGTEDQAPLSSTLVQLLLVLSLLLNAWLGYRLLGKQRKNGLPLDELTRQERIIVDGILRDKTNKEIAADLFISHSTVKTHINNLYRKLRVNDRDGLKMRFRA